MKGGKDTLYLRYDFFLEKIVPGLGDSHEIGSNGSIINVFQTSHTMRGNHFKKNALKVRGTGHIWEKSHENTFLGET